MKLWEISGKMQGFTNLIAEIQESELTQEEKDNRLNHVFEDWKECAATMEDKLMAIAAYIRQKKAILAVQTEEIKRIQMLACKTESDIDNLTRYAQAHMEQTGVKSVKDELGSISLRKNRPSVMIHLPPELIPKEYVTVKTYETPNKKAIEEAVKEGTINWAELRSSGNHLVVK
jgi:hypothetical protein